MQAQADVELGVLLPQLDDALHIGGRAGTHQDASGESQGADDCASNAGPAGSGQDRLNSSAVLLYARLQVMELIRGEVAVAVHEDHAALK